MIPENRTVMVHLRQSPSTRREHGGARDHDDTGARSLEGDPSGAATQADVAPSWSPARALGPADRTTVCAGAHRGAPGDRPSGAGPTPGSSAAGGGGRRGGRRRPARARPAGGPVGAGAHRGAPGDRPSVAGPTLESSAAGGT